MEQINTQSDLTKRKTGFGYNERQIMSAWEAFLTGGEENEFSSVRPLVKESWNLCKSQGIDAHGTGALLRNDEDFLYKLRQENRDLMTAAKESLLMLQNLLDGTSAMIILTDRNGVILESFGDTKTLDAGRDINLEIGGGWDEKVAGTNGIGTALRARKPVFIHAAEHYCQDVKAWTCAAAPIFDPFDGSVVGIVDLSGPTEIFQRHNMTVPVIAALQIEQILHQRHSNERLQLMEACFSSAPKINEGDGLVLLDQNGRVVCLKNAPQLEIENDIKRSIKTGDRLFSLEPNMSEADMAASLSAKFNPELVHTLCVDNNVRGAMLVFENKRRGKSSTEIKPVKPEETEVVPPPLILGTSSKIKQVIKIVERIAAGRGSVLIEGETGVGKELFGQLFHAHAAQTKAAPYCTINCGAITKDLFGGELFGHVSGAFTGALREGKKGKFEEADGGVLCLDEIGEMPLDMQPFLLRALEEKVIYRLGENVARSVDVRLVALTNRNLLEEVEAGNFRKDLYYRIGALKVQIPPLRERSEDVPILIDHFNRLAARELDVDMLQFSDDALEALTQYYWPGNVRELRNLVESLHLTSPGRVIDLEDIEACNLDINIHPHDDDIEKSHWSGSTLQGLANVEAVTIQKVIDECNGNLTKAAKQLGIARSTLYRKIAQSQTKTNRL